MEDTLGIRLLNLGRSGGHHFPMWQARAEPELRGVLDQDQRAPADYLVAHRDPRGVRGSQLLPRGVRMEISGPDGLLGCLPEREQTTNHPASGTSQLWIARSTGWEGEGQYKKVKVR